ncbi:hydroxysteroid 11-beta-dehydrogenase 1-like protein isoform X2 [Physella acuta]|nr:hydroxysteroid 11-beta-dehydrogenase 1-like protein isoform X2 [Physella acuta]XP_059158584.1 hydroxysteroid 11-beta-dehydrogenase 1-like protein isoform X2 [Physella acuta]XP_059158585.1 hydroxysteroid 11-beta-dehydrogenase 1-like protein isoform X2 [Physella acuta]
MMRNWVGAVAALLVGLMLARSFFDDSQLETLKGKRVLVTGASTGIGEQLAYQYARLGAKVAVTARRKDVLLKVTERCKQLSPNNLTHHAIPADMGQLNSTAAVIQEAIASLGGLDILVLNHITSQPIVQFLGTNENISSFDKTIDINFRSYVHLTSHALPQLIANKGSLVVVNSMLGKVPHPYLASYSASKHALHGFFESLRSQFIFLEQDVSVTLCTLGLIGTENALNQLQNNKQDKTLQAVSAASPQDTALAIVEAGARRQKNVFYPFWTTWTFSFMRSLFPETMDYIFIKMVMDR